MRNPRWSKLWKILTRFVAGQCLVQGLNLLLGLLLIRWLSLKDYAEYSSAFAFQITLNMLVDLGFSTTIVSLVGEQTSDPAVIGGYILAARTERLRMFSILGAASGVLFPFVVARQPWPWHVKVLLWCSIMCSVFVQTQMIYGSALLISQRVGQYYKAGIAASFERLIAASLLHFSRVLSGWSACWVNVSYLFLNSHLFYRYSRDIVLEPLSVDPAKRAAMRNLILRNLPNHVFFAFQGQIMLLLITIFGTTKNIAQVGALGRLGQIFTLFGAIGPIVIEPIIARSARSTLGPKYVGVVICGAALTLIATYFGFKFPGLFALILGPQYAGLNLEIGFSIAASAVSFMIALLWTLNSARQWVYLPISFIYIIAVVTVQIITLYFLKLNTTLAVTQFGLITALTGLAVHVLNSVTGFIIGVPSQKDVSTVI